MAKRVDKSKVKEIKAIKPENVNILHTIAFAGLGLLLFLPPFFRGLFFAPDQQMALFFAVIVFWLSFIYSLSDGKPRLLSHPLDYLVLSLPVVYLISSFNSVNVGLAVNEIVKTLLYLFIYGIVVNIVTEEKGAVRLLNIIALGGCLAGVAGLFTATGLISIKDGFVGGRIYSTFQYPNALASFLAVAFIVTLYLLLTHEEKYSVKSGKKKFFYYAQKSKYILGAYIVLTVFVGTKSNGGYLVFIPALLLYLIGLPRGKRINAVFSLLIVGGAAVPSALAFIKFAVEGKHALAWLCVFSGFLVVALLFAAYESLKRKGLWDKLNQKKNLALLLLGVVLFVIAVPAVYYLNSNSQAVAEMLEQFRLRNAVERTYFYRDALKMISERPLLGWGGGGWQEAYQAYQGYLYFSRQVHGYYLQVAVETGITGLLLILSIWGVFFHTSYRAIRDAGDNPGRRSLLWTVFISAVIIGLHAAIDFNLSLSALALVLWTMWALMRSVGADRAETGGRSPKHQLINKPNGVMWGVTVFLLLLIMGTGCLITSSSSAREAGSRITKKDIPGAISSLEKAAFYNPFNPEYHFSPQSNLQLSFLYNLTGKNEEAIAQVEEAIAKSKYNPHAHAGLARLYLLAGNTDKAVSEAEKAVELAPYDINLYNVLSRTYFMAGAYLMEKGQKDSADGMFNKTIQVEGRINEQVSKLGPVERSLWNVAPMLAPSEYTRLYSGASYCLLEDYQKAESNLKAVAGDSKIKAEALLWLSLAAKRQGNLAGSGELIVQAKTLVPDAEKQFQYVFNLINKSDG